MHSLFNRLYTHIPHTEGIAAARKALENRPVRQPPTEDIVQLIKLVLSRNCFTCKEQHYKQITGTAMGTRMAPSYANLFMSSFEQDLLDAAPGPTPDHMKRFIDDIFMIWSHGEESLKQFHDYANIYMFTTKSSSQWSTVRGHLQKFYTRVNLAGALAVSWISHFDGDR